MEPEPILSIIIVNYNSGQMTLMCLDSIQKHAAHISHEVIIADNASKDGSPELITRKHPEVLFLPLKDNLGFGVANNRAAAFARGKYLLLLNNDALLLENSLDPLLATVQNDSSIGVVGPEIHYPDGRFQLSCGPDLSLFGELLMKHFSRWYSRMIQKGPALQQVDWISGAAMLIPAVVYRQVNGFDETFFLYMEDADLCRRIRTLGFSILLNRRSIVQHHQGESTSAVKTQLLPAIKRGHLHYYTRYNSRFSKKVLKWYLYLQFRLNRQIPPDINKQLMDIIRR